MKICIIGAGYVGLTTAAVLADFGHTIECVDIDNEKINQITKKDLPIFEPGLDELLHKNHERLSFHSGVKLAVERNNLIIITVGTPALPDGSTDLSALQAVFENICEEIKQHKTIVVKSTVPPGTNNKMRELLLRAGVPAHLFSIVSNPEFLREGSAINDMISPSKTVVGIMEGDCRSLEIMKKIYEPISAPIVTTSLNGAEMIKYANNFFLATKISFINEMARFCEAVDVDVNDVADAIGLDPRIGPSFLQAGIGYGGSCFPKDLKSLQYFADESMIGTRILQAVQEINQSQISLYVDKLADTVGDLSRLKVTILGVAFKPRTADTRESAALRVMEALFKAGCKMSVYDPIAKIPDTHGHMAVQCDTLADAMRGSDCLFLATEWEEFLTLDWVAVKRLMKQHYIVDGRNYFNHDYLEQQGFTMVGIGRGNNKTPVKYPLNLH